MSQQKGTAIVRAGYKQALTRVCALKCYTCLLARQKGLNLQLKCLRRPSVYEEAESCLFSKHCRCQGSEKSARMIKVSELTIKEGVMCERPSQRHAFTFDLFDPSRSTVSSLVTPVVLIKRTAKELSTLVAL